MENYDHSIFDVVVVGGGAAGMMAAGRAAERGKRVLLLEKNKTLGEKLKITGGGRCNITNAEFDGHIFLGNYGKAGQFLHTPLAQFGVKDTFSFFEKRGLPLVVQARKRAFPHTEKALDVYLALEKYIRSGRVQVQVKARVTRVVTEAAEGGNKKIVEVVTRGGTYKGKTFIFSTGGMSHRETGSTGDGFSWLADLGHTVSEPTPTIVPLAVKEQWVKNLSGVSLSFMKITFYVDSVKQFSQMGKILFTHFGLSGPLILNNAYKVKDLLKSGTVTAEIDAFPHTDLGTLDRRIVALFNKSKNKMLKNVFEDIAPWGTSESILSLLGGDTDPAVKVHSVTKEERSRIVHLLKALPLTVTGLMGYDRAVIADGGVSPAEIDVKTMRSKKVENLYIIGDLLHITRPSGGYSLQLCWTTGYVAGSHV